MINPFDSNTAIYGPLLPQESALESQRSLSAVTAHEEYLFRYEFSSTFSYRFVHNFKRTFPGRWGVMWCLFGVLVIALVMVYLLWHTFKKKTQFLKINKKAAENLSDEESESAGESQENNSPTKVRNDPGGENNLEKIEEQSESEEEESIDFSQVANKPDQPLGPLEGSQFDNNSVYEHVRAHYDKNSKKIFRDKGRRKKQIKNKPEQNKENRPQKPKRKKKKKRKKTATEEPVDVPESKPKLKKKTEGKFKLLIKRAEIKIFIVVNMGLFCLFAFSTETLLISFHNLKFLALEKGSFDLAILKDKLGLSQSILVGVFALLSCILVLMFVGFVFGVFQRMFSSHWKPTLYFKVTVSNQRWHACRLPSNAHPVWLAFTCSFCFCATLCWCSSSLSR